MATSFTPYSFNHRLLGPLTGRVPSSTPGVVNFRSIPYATIPARFRQSILLDRIPLATSRDFTNYATACPANSDDQVIEKVGGLLPGEERKEYDEFNCLNLTINAPQEALGDDKKLLPVMVYVHGGAFLTGAGHISAYEDTTNLVNLSIREGHPMVIISIHYRLNWQGFLACQDLLDEAASTGEAPANFGFYDQRTAFLWVKRHVSGFGGDPNCITAFGQSAGSTSIAVHMCSDVPLFSRAILMSGVISSVPPIDLKYKELEYLELLKGCGINRDDPGRLSKLREVPVEKLIEVIAEAGIPVFNSLKDETLFPKDFPTYWSEDALIGNCEWVDAVMIGDTFWEGFEFHKGLMSVLPDSFISFSKNTLGESYASKILSAYKITSKMDVNLFWSNMTYLIGDVMFSQPTDKLANFLAAQRGPNKKKVYRYTVTARNPFLGSPLNQVPGHHFVDLIYLFGTLTGRYPTQRQRSLSTEFGKRWLKFGAGLEPWQEYRLGEGEGKIMVISGADGFKVKTREVDEEESRLAEEGERRYAGWEAIGEVMEDLVSDKHSVVHGEVARRAWGTDGGMFILMGLKGPWGVVL